MKYLSLFSGIGGFEYGLEQANGEFECIGFSEIDKYAKSIYLGHFPRHKDLGDASEIRAEELPDFDLLVGGFPCQAFSISGYRKGFDDTRGTLFFEIARILKEKRPKYFLLENVKGLLSHDGSRTFKKMLGILSELGYDVEWQVLNSKSVGGVPQNRERLYIKGYFRAKCGREILSQKRDCTETSVRLNPFHFNRQVKKRVYDCDYMELCDFLRSHKRAANATVKDISEKLGVSKSEVEHWFRKDNYFAPPPPKVWVDLKSILNITSTEYDDFIMTWEYVDGVYEMDKRAYDENGLAPTLTTRDESLIKINKVGTTSPTGHWGKNVYSPNGVSPTLCSGGAYKNGIRVLLDEEPEIKVVGNLSNTGHNGDNVLDTTGVSSTLTASNYKHPLRIKENVDVEKVYNTTRDFNKGETDGSYTPCLTASMGCGGNNVPMMKLKTNTKKGYDEVTTGDGVRLCHPTSTKARGRTQQGQTGALSTSADWGTVDRDYRIRKLTPKECERLQAFPDGWTEYGKDGEKISDTQRYKCLGNAVTTTVVTYVANIMFSGVKN